MIESPAKPKPIIEINYDSPIQLKVILNIITQVEFVGTTSRDVNSSLDIEEIELIQTSTCNGECGGTVINNLPPLRCPCHKLLEECTWDGVACS